MHTLLPKIFLHQCLFHQFQLFKALLYGLFLLVYTFHKSGKLVLWFKRWKQNFQVIALSNVKVLLRCPTCSFFYLFLSMRIIDICTEIPRIYLAQIRVCDYYIPQILL